MKPAAQPPATGAVPATAPAWTPPHDLPHARWRTARKEHWCSHWWSHSCTGTGRIARGARYLDTGELTCEPGTAFATHRCCAACVAVHAPESVTA